jgi:septum formation protein
MKTKPKIILASASPRRKEILSLLFDTFEILPANIDESVVSFKNPKKAVSQLAKKKALSVYEKNQESVVIGADTIVVYKNKVLGKPKDKEDAFNMLKLLSGKKHKVITGVAIISKQFQTEFFEISDVYFSTLTDDEINKYIETKEPFDKAGSYAIQGIAGKFIEKIKGDYHNIVGFPLHKTYSILKISVLKDIV